MPRHLVHAALVIALIAPMVVATSAAAQPATVQAEQLFRDGKRLMGEGKLPEACKAFEGSYRKDPVVSTLLNLADCRDKNTQYASAWGHFLDAERMTRGKAGEANLNTTARTRAAALESKLSYLIINVPADASVDGLVISRNGVAVDEAEWNSDIPVDGGPYVIEGKAPGYEAWSTKVFVGVSGDKESVNVPRFRDRPKSDKPVVVGGDGGGVGTKPAGDPGDRAEAPDRVGDRRSGRKTIGMVSVAGGGALVLGGLAVGYLAQQQWSEAKELCGADLLCDSPADHAAGQELVDGARFRGNVATIVTGAGIAAVGVGVVMWLTAPRAERRRAAVAVAPVVSSDGFGLVIGGAL